MKAVCIVLTAGERPAEVARALASAAAQRGAEVEVMLVANGCEPPPVPDRTRVLALGDNVGPAAARNRAVEEAAADVLFFLDDDTSYPDEDLVARALERFEADPALGVISFRVEDPAGRPPQRRHVPRLRAGDPARSGEATTFLEGACAIRRQTFERAGGYPEAFFFGHEGTDLAWRAIDAGYRIWYAGDLRVHHPAEPATRHPFHHRLTMRNRVFLARRLLPLPLAACYGAVWVLIGVARARSAGAVREVIRGIREGLSGDAGGRRPISWRAVWRMTRAGRPPVL